MLINQEYTYTGILLLAIYGLLKFFVPVLRDRLFGDVETTEDPFESNTKRNRNLLQKWDDKINSGYFTCQWQGRDEIRDFKDGILNLTREIVLLREELTKTRNGG